jgi:uncharacterized MAPEG superfamily protein
MTPTVAHFTLAYWCVLIAALIPIGCAYIAKQKAQGGFDNHHPREWLGRQTGISARANAAQSNCFENLPFFIGAVVIAHQLGARQSLVDLLAIGYVTVRCGYVAAYLSDRASLRSALFVAGLALNIGLLFCGA